MLLHTAERSKRVFYASAHCRKTKKDFFMLLHTAERSKRVFHASAHCRKTKKKYYKKESIKIQLSLT